MNPNFVKANATAKAGAVLRAEAARVLIAVVFEQRSLKAALPDTLALFPDPRDRALLEAICFSALRHRRHYDFALTHWLGKPLGRRDLSIHALLWVGLAQIDALGLPAYAAVASTADAARILQRAGMVGLVNAILRRAVREGLPHSPERAIQSSHPDWLVEQLALDWPDSFETILDANNQAAPLWLRTNAPRVSRDDLLERFRGESLSAYSVAFPLDALRIDERVSPLSLPGWQQGDFAVQDAAAQLAVIALAPQPHDYVLDACAAPGGKTAQLAAILNEGELLALDNQAARLEKVRQTLRRLGLANFSVNSSIKPHILLLAADAIETAHWWDGRPFDAIMLDAPCSATGIIRRQPDIKWHRRAEDIAALTTLQARLLDALWPLLKTGGRLLYATCAVLKDENERQIDAFMARTPDAFAQPLDDRFGHISGVGRQRFPGEDGMDGFFYALLQKRGDK